MNLEEAVMDCVPKSPLLEVSPDTIQCLRKTYGLDTPESREDAINIFLDWIKKQDHFIQKDISRDRLERMIILNKGSVERTKLKHDKICTFRTMLGEYFEPINVKNLENLYNCFLPKMTKDFYRVFLHKNSGQRFQHGLFDYFKSTILAVEYLLAHDYFNGIIVIVDFLETNLFEVIRTINFIELGKALSIIKDGYGARIKAFHFISTSKAVDTFVSLMKQALSSKMSDRIHTHRTVDALYEHLDKDILPSDYGGKEDSIVNLSNKLMNELTSEEFKEHFNETKKAGINKSLRSQEKFNEYMGVEGSFRKLNVD